MKQFKNYRYSRADDKNWLLEQSIQSIATKDTKRYKKGDTTYGWHFRGYYSSLEDLFMRMVDLVGLDGRDSDLLGEIRELKEFIRKETKNDN